EVERRDPGDDPERLAHGVDVYSSPGALGELALHQVWYADGELDHLDSALNVAFRIGDGLTVLPGQLVGQLVVVPGHEIDEFHQDAGTALRVRRRPGRLGCLRVLDRGPHLVL